jgi:hypothetical protein
VQLCRHVCLAHRRARWRGSSAQGLARTLVAWCAAVPLWPTPQVFERMFKSVTHDSYAISVAPPKLYGTRFADFLTKAVFMDPVSPLAKGLVPPRPAGADTQYGAGVSTIHEESD